VLTEALDVLSYFGAVTHAELVTRLSVSTDPEVWLIFDVDGVVLGRGEDWNEPEVWWMLHYPFTPTALANGITMIERQEVLTPE